jgi:N-acetyl-gamma-glutamyl-phosphate reductase
VQAGIVPADYPLTCFSLTGYSGGGKKMIASYEDTDRSAALDAPGIYGLSLAHKHLPEMQMYCGLAEAPVFLPVVDDYYKGMATTIMLQNALLPGNPTTADIHAALAAHYADQRLVGVLPLGENGSTLYANMMSGTDSLVIVVCGNDRQTSVTALFDNLGKGASGAAVQNMNIVLGLDEAVGLSL